MWYGTSANPIISSWSAWKRFQWTQRARSLYTFGNIIFPVSILAWLVSFFHSFSSVNGLTWCGLKTSIYKLEPKSILSKLLKSEAKRSHILLSLYSSLNSVGFVFKKQDCKKQKPLSLLPLSYISLSLVYYLFLIYFPLSMFLSLSQRSWTVQISVQVQPHWHDSKETLRGVLLLYFLTNILQSSDCFILCLFSELINIMSYNLSQWNKKRK